MRNAIARLAWLLPLVAAAGCATTRAKPASIEFEPVTIAPEAKDLELTNLNDEELFALGTSAFAAQDYEHAARCFSRLADLFPDSKHRPEAMYNAGLAYERLHKFAEALERFRPLIDPRKGTGDALAASFRTAECYYHLDDFAPAIEILTIIAEREDVPAQDRLEAKVHRGICMIEAGDLDGAEKQLRESLNWWAAKKESERLDEYFPGQAQFFLGEIYRTFFEHVELDPDKGEDLLYKDLEYKCELLLSSQGHYLRAIRIGDGEWATAAGFRIGALYESLYDAMLNARVPQGFDEEQAQVYREELRKKVKVLVTKAMNIYERTLAAAERIGTENAFVQKTRQSLDRMKKILVEAEPAPANEEQPVDAQPDTASAPRPPTS